jgi:hypothetical protein
VSSEDPGSSEYDYEFLMTTEERDHYDREQQVAREAAAAAEEARLADLERRWAEVVGADIFGRPLASPRTPQIEAADDLDLEPG